MVKSNWLKLFLNSIYEILDCNVARRAFQQCAQRLPEN
jgi:hypothetical protein